MIIGNFIYDPEADTYAGSLATLTIRRDDLRFRPVEKSGSKDPDYRILSETPTGPIEYGAAWKRTSEHGREFVSVSLDDPALNAPLNAALFHDAGDNLAMLVWNRPKAKAKAEPAGQKAA